MNQDRVIRPASGGVMVLVNIVLYLVFIGFFARGVGQDQPAVIIGSMLVLGLAILTSRGFFVVNPNYGALLLLFGKYNGTVRSNGFYWANPFLTRIKISLRIRNLEGSKLKVNDKTGNPIEIAMVVVWRIVDAFRAQFEVDNYAEFVRIQSESALRHLATNYAYDGADNEETLRGSIDQVSAHLKDELKERMERAGVEVLEARLAHLAYAPEIAGEMLRKQQATAVVAARTLIVEGAVGMVEHALDELNKRKLVQLDDERRAAMVSNLLVVLCSEHATTPVINTGTLYQ